MKRYLFSLILAMLAVLAWAGKYSAKTLPLPANNVENPSYVSNPDRILSGTTVDSVNVLLRQLDHDKEVKVLVIVVEHLDPDDPFEFSYNVGKMYGVGSKRQNAGLIITLATLDRSYYILTSYGLEQYLPDGLCRDIENRSMLPSLKEGRWDKAILTTVQDVHHLLINEEALNAEIQRLAAEDEADRQAAMAAGIIFAILFSVVIYLIWYADHKNRYCKICERHEMKMLKRTCNRLNKRQMKVTEIWQCPHCGNVETRERIANTGEQYENAIFLGGGSHGGGGHHGGGWTGGSFGGGSFGGGGAGGRF